MDQCVCGAYTRRKCRDTALPCRRRRIAALVHRHRPPLWLFIQLVGILLDERGRHRRQHSIIYSACGATTHHFALSIGHSHHYTNRGYGSLRGSFATACPTFRQNRGPGSAFGADMMTSTTTCGLLFLLWLPLVAFCGSSGVMVSGPGKTSLRTQTPPNWVFPEDCAGVMQQFSAQLDRTPRISLTANPSPRPQDAEFKAPYDITNGTCKMRFAFSGDMGQAYNYTFTKDMIWGPASSLNSSMFPGGYAPWQTGYIEWRLNPSAQRYTSILLQFLPVPQ